MLRKITNPVAVVVVSAALLAACMLGFYRNASAQQSRGNPLPFSNSVQQRGEMVTELKEIKGLLREQNALLRTLVKHAAKSTDTPDQQPARGIR